MHRPNPRSRANVGPQGHASRSRRNDASNNSMNLTVLPLTPDRWPDVEKLFNAKGCSVARGCWCMYYRRSGSRGALPAGTTRAQANRTELKAVDHQPVWSIICFVVPSEHRGQGVARALLKGAIAYARKQGATLLEAYPVDRRGRSNDDSMWFGAKSMYDGAGFTEVARRKPRRPIVRLKPA